MQLSSLLYMDINSIIYVDNTNHHIKGTDQDITWVQWCCERFWQRHHLFVIRLSLVRHLCAWWQNRTCTSVWILLHQIKGKSQRTLICCWSRVHGVRLVKDIIRVAIDEPTWSDGLHSWRSIDLIQSWSQSYLCFNRNPHDRATGWYGS